MLLPTLDTSDRHNTLEGNLGVWSLGTRRNRKLFAVRYSHCGAPLDSVQLVHITTISIGFMVVIPIVR